MSAYDYDDEPRRHRSHRHHRDDRIDDRAPRYVETQETYVRAPAGAMPLAPDAPYTSTRTDIIRRPAREDSEQSVEEIRRDFPPPAGAYLSTRGAMVQRDRYDPPARARSADRSGYGGYDDRDRRYDDDRRARKSTYVEQEIEPRRRSLSRNQKIIAAVGGAALAVGGKELWDRKQADGRPVSRNVLSTAAIGAAGAFAGYEATELYSKHAAKTQKTKTYVAHQGRNGEVAEYYSEDEVEEPKKSRRKSIVEGALGLAGLGAAAKAVGDKNRSRSRHGSPDSHHSRKRSKSRSGRGKSPEGVAKFQQAAKAALLAGATEAFRVRKEPGGWGGAKGKRILTAAIGAGGIDAAADRNPERKSKRHILEAVVGGLAGNRLINGSRSNVAEDDRRSRSRSRARSRSRGHDGGSGMGQGAGLAALATAGLGALAGKKLLDRSRSRDRRGSPDSYDSRSPSPKRDKHKRSKSITDYARKGLASVGLGHEADDKGRRRRNSRSEDDDSDYDRRRSRGSRGDAYGDPRYADSRSSNVGSRSGRGKEGGRDRRVAEGKQSPSDSESLGSSSGDEKRIRKMKGKQLITTGLAAVATLHAAHNIYQSMEKRDARRKAVAEGEMTPEEARKLKAKAMLQDTASVGIAALGIKGAISEIKEANEMRRECKEFREKKEERHRKRLERQKSSHSGNDRYGDGGRRRYDAIDSPSSPRNNGPHYSSANPYAAGALPAPPVGYR